LKATIPFPRLRFVATAASAIGINAPIGTDLHSKKMALARKSIPLRIKFYHGVLMRREARPGFPGIAA
jgi:hypothetical protein